MILGSGPGRIMNGNPYDSGMIQRLAEMGKASAMGVADPHEATRRMFRAGAGEGHVRRLAMGKAARGMLLAAREVDGRPCEGELVVTHEPWTDAGARVVVGSHPYLDARSFEAGDEVDSWVRGVRPEESLVVLLSGGASALASAPWPVIDREMYAKATRQLIESGTPIAELNCVRRHCERLKGGGLTRACAAKSIEVYVLSDVIGDDLATIASGPFAVDSTTNVDAAEILEKRLGAGATALAQVLRREDHPETLKVADTRVAHTIVASNAMVVRAVAEEIGGEIAVTTVRTNLEGDVEAIAAALEPDAAFVRIGSGARAMVFGGEYTVNASGATGVGGPSQELALRLAEVMLHEVHPWSRHAHWGIWTFSTDGRDGPTDACGAMIHDGMFIDAGMTALALHGAIERHDSSGFLRTVGGLIQRCSTGTNLNHVGILAAW